MPQCNFSIHFKTSPIEIVDKARNAITGAGGTFQGNELSGNFEVSTPFGSIRGSYAIQHLVIHVSINSKPFLISCGIIEKQLKNYFQTMA